MLAAVATLSAFTPTAFAPPAAVLPAFAPTALVRRSAEPTALLSLGDADDFDPFMMAPYPDPTCESEIHRVRLSTTAGDCTVTLDRALSPIGVDHFLRLVADGFFTDQLLYRVMPGFLVQFGVASDPMVQARWEGSVLPDEPNRASFSLGTLSFAGNGPNSRNCHLFVALEPQGTDLGGAAHETTLGHVEEVEVFEKVAANFDANEYPYLGDLQGQLVSLGNEAAQAYPNLDRILKAEILEA